MKKPLTLKAAAPWIGCALFALVDILMVNSLVGQWRSGRFAATEGRILQSAVRVEKSQDRDSNGNVRVSYSFEVRFEYHVAGQRHESNRHRINSVSSGSESAAAQRVAAFPVGANRMVYYDPTDPSVAVLEAGFTRGDAAWAAGLFIANVVAVFVGWFLLRKKELEQIGGALVRTRGDELHVWLNPFAAGIGAVVTFVVVGGGAVGLLQLDPDVASTAKVLAGGLLGAVVAAVAVFVSNRNKQRRRSPDLVFHAAQGTLTRLRPPAPSLTGPDSIGAWKTWYEAKHTPVILPFDAIRAIEVRAETIDEETRDHKVIAKVADADGTESEWKLASWSDAEQADSFAQWVRSTLGLT